MMPSWRRRNCRGLQSRRRPSCEGGVLLNGRKVRCKQRASETRRNVPEEGTAPLEPGLRPGTRFACALATGLALVKKSSSSSELSPPAGSFFFGAGTRLLIMGAEDDLLKAVRDEEGAEEGVGSALVVVLLDEEG